MNEAALPGSRHPTAGPLRLLSDARLVRSAIRGEQRAFAAIFQRYHQELYRYCRAILRNEEEARDALQNTMVKVLQALPGEGREIALRPWLYRIAHNEAIAMLRQRPPDSSELSDEIPAALQTEHRAEARDRLRHLLKDLESLPERQRGALVMRELSGIDYAEIGTAFQASAAVARQTVYEARIALQEMAEGREMSCEVIREALSGADGRVLRGRKLRAHLRGCEGCREFRAGIRQRRTDLAALAPPLPALAAAGLLHNILGSGHAGGGTSGLLASSGGVGKTLAGSAALKSAAAVVATATLAVGTAGVAGVIHLPVINGSGGSPARTSRLSRGEPANVVANGARDHAAGSAEAIAQRRHRLEKQRSARRHAGARAANSAAHSHSASHPSGPQSGVGPQIGSSHAPTSLPPPAQSHPPAAGPGAGTSHPSTPSSPPSPPSPSTPPNMPGSVGSHGP